MRGLNFIAVHINGHAPLCRLCGELMVEWTATDNFAWLCFNCDVVNDA